MPLEPTESTKECRGADIIKIGYKGASCLLRLTASLGQPKKHISLTKNTDKLRKSNELYRNTPR